MIVLAYEGTVFMEQVLTIMILLLCRLAPIPQESPSKYPDQRLERDRPLQTPIIYSNHKIYDTLSWDD